MTHYRVTVDLAKAEAHQRPQARAEFHSFASSLDSATLPVDFQVHTLLAAYLIGDESAGLLPGEPPSPAEITAATDGSDLTPAGGITGRFNLVDAYGDWIWNEGRPADIPQIEGERVVVLDPPPYLRSWNAGAGIPLDAPQPDHRPHPDRRPGGTLAQHRQTPTALTDRH